MKRLLPVLVLALVVAVGCGGDDGGSGDGGSGSADPALVELLQTEGGQPEVIAVCVAERLAADERVDPDELEAIVRGEGSTDVDTATAYGDAAFGCAQDRAEGRLTEG